jgi:hypothetical protein
MVDEQSTSSAADTTQLPSDSVDAPPYKRQKCDSMSSLHLHPTESPPLTAQSGRNRPHSPRPIEIDAVNAPFAMNMTGPEYRRRRRELAAIEGETFHDNQRQRKDDTVIEDSRWPSELAPFNAPSVVVSESTSLADSRKDSDRVSETLQFSPAPSQEQSIPFYDSVEDENAHDADFGFRIPRAQNKDAAGGDKDAAGDDAAAKKSSRFTTEEDRIIEQV